MKRALVVALLAAACATTKPAATPSSDNEPHERPLPQLSRPAQQAATPTSDNEPHERQPKDFHANSTSEHFELFWERAETTDAEVAAVTARAEQGYAALAKRLGAAHPVPAKAQLVLDGDGLGPDGSLRNVSTVSLKNGAMYLYRFPGAGGAYEASLVHELTHLIRLELTRQHLPDYATGYGFVEEGFAELMAMEAGFPSIGFPTYGVPVEVVAGQWVKATEALPLTSLMHRHGELNGRCYAQAYAQRVSFFLLLKERFGMERVIEWAYSPDAADSARFLKVFGETMATMFNEWAPWAAKRFEAVADGEAQARHYRTETPAKYFPVCKPDDLK